MAKFIVNRSLTGDLQTLNGSAFLRSQDTAFCKTNSPGAPKTPKHPSKSCMVGILEAVRMNEKCQNWLFTTDGTMIFVASSQTS